MRSIRCILAAVVLALWLAPAVAMPAAFWTVMLDNQPVPAELPPVPAGNGVLLVAARSLCEHLGADYSYDAQTGLITIADAVARLALKEGDVHATVNGRHMDLPVAPRKEGGTLMIPAPWVPQALGFKASWDTATHMLFITSTEVAQSPSAARAAAQAAGRDGAASPAGSPANPIQTPAYPTAVVPTAPEQSASTVSMPRALPPSAIGPPPLIAGKSGLTAPGSPISMASVGMPASTSPPSAMPPTGMGTGMPSTMTPPGMSTGMPSAMSPYEETRVGMGQSTPPPGAPETYTVTSGKMDNLENRSLSGVSGPDPAITGLMLERRYDTLTNSYTVHYRVTNVGDRPAVHEMLVRLLIGDGGGMQIVQDIKVDKLDVGQSLDFEWTGTGTTCPVLNSMTVYAEARVMVNEGIADVNPRNNSRRVKLTY